MKNSVIKTENDINYVVVNGMDAIRASIITKRSDSIELGWIKAMMISNLKTKLSNGIGHFLYCRRDGSIREAWGTCVPQLCSTKVNGLGESREKYHTTAYFDIEKGAWRSFRWDAIIKVF